MLPAPMKEWIELAMRAVDALERIATALEPEQPESAVKTEENRRAAA